MAFEPVVVDALNAALLSVGSTLLALLGEDAELFELSMIQSEPGTPRQAFHADFPPYKDTDVVAFVVFLALEDQVSGMGPTIFLPRTHTRLACENWHRLPKSQHFLYTRL